MAEVCDRNQPGKWLTAGCSWLLEGEKNGFPHWPARLVSVGGVIALSY